MTTSPTSVKDILLFLNNLEKTVDIRIHQVDVINTRLRNNKRILTEALHYVEEEGSHIDLAQKAEVSSSSNNTLPPLPAEDAAFSLPNKLDEILNLAKVMREPHAKGSNAKDVKIPSDQASVSSTSSKQTIKTTSSSTSKTTVEKRTTSSGKYSVMTKPPPNTNTKATNEVSSSSNKPSSARATVSGKERTTPRPQPLYQALIQENTCHTDKTTEPTQNPVAPPKPTLPSPKHQVEQQLFLLNKQRVLSMLKPGFMFTPKLLQAQSSILTNSNCILPIPKSLLFTTLETLQKITFSFDKSAFEALSSENKEHYLERIDGNIEKLITAMSRSPVSRINTLPISHFTTEQFCELVQYWYRGKLLINFVMSMIKEIRHNKLQSESTKIREYEQSLQAMILSSIDFPRPEPNEIDENYKVGGKSAWLQQSQKANERHFKQSKHLAKFCFEFYCSEAIMPKLHKSLRRCAQTMQNNGHIRTPTKSGIDPTQKWKEVLKCYQIVYTLLVSGGKDHAGCVFMDK